MSQQHFDFSTRPLVPLADASCQVVQISPLRVRLPDIGDRLANLQHKLWFGKAEGLWRIFKGPVGLRLRTASGTNLPRARGGQGWERLFKLGEHESAARPQWPAPDCRLANQ